MSQEFNLIYVRFPRGKYLTLQQNISETFCWMHSLHMDITNKTSAYIPVFLFKLWAEVSTIKPAVTHL